MTQGNGEGRDVAGEDDDELGPAPGSWSARRSEDASAEDADVAAFAVDADAPLAPPSDEQPVMVIDDEREEPTRFAPRRTPAADRPEASATQREAAHLGRIVGVDESDDELAALPPRLVVGVDDSEDDAPALRQHGDEVLPKPDLPAQGSDNLGQAYGTLEIRTPLEELEGFARARVEALARAGQAERAGLSADALRLAQSALRRVMGALPREAP